MKRLLPTTSTWTRVPLLLSWALVCPLLQASTRLLQVPSDSKRCSRPVHQQTNTSRCVVFLLRFWTAHVSHDGAHGSTYAPSNEHETSWSNPLPIPGSSADGCTCCTRRTSRRLAARTESFCESMMLLSTFLSPLRPGQVSFLCHGVVAPETELLHK